jgi:phosphoribosylformylglycinamidine synthase subunit PurQ / glutaminase
LKENLFLCINLFPYNIPVNNKKIAVISFPGTNNEIESIRAIERAGMDPMFFKWNDDIAKLADVDGYFIAGGFSYEDRGRAGMVAARDPLIEFIGKEAEAGKVIIGHCNGAQILIESGLIPLGNQLSMSLARNAIGEESTGFLNEWIWITPACQKDRCAVSNWSGAMQMPIAHGEGRFTTKDKDLFDELKKNDQIAFKYCDKDGNASENSSITPNGSEFAIAGICNPAGNVIALMPHPERTVEGDPYFVSMKEWLEGNTSPVNAGTQSEKSNEIIVNTLPETRVEIFIENIITNNEERTVEQAAKKTVPSISINQLKYFAPSNKDPVEVLQTISLFNSNKEKAYIRRGKDVFRWNAEEKVEEPTNHELITPVMILRVDQPDTGASAIGGGQTGICYACSNVSMDQVMNQKTLEIFGNPHASTLWTLN